MKGTERVNGCLRMVMRLFFANVNMKPKNKMLCGMCTEFSRNCIPPSNVINGTQVLCLTKKCFYNKISERTFNSLRYVNVDQKWMV